MNPVSKLFRSPLFNGLFVGILVFFGVIGLRSTGSLESLELTTYDWYIRLQPEVPDLDSRIVLIEINERDQHQAGRSLTDATVARLLETLARFHPRVIGLDIYRDIPVPPGSKKLDTMLTENHTIIAAMTFGSEEKVGELSLKGKAQKITAHCLVGRVDEHSNVIEGGESV